MALSSTSPTLSGAPDTTSGHQGRLQRLEPEECWRLLSTESVGRFVFLDSRGPVAVPVNYVLAEGHRLVFRTEAHGNLALRAGQVRVSLEVDHIDPSFREGWSVVASGHSHVARPGPETEALGSLDVEPWADGVREAYVVITVQEITGRRVRHTEAP